MLQGFISQIKEERTDMNFTPQELLLTLNLVRKLEALQANQTRPLPVAKLKNPSEHPGFTKQVMHLIRNISNILDPRENSSFLSHRSSGLHDSTYACGLAYRVRVAIYMHARVALRLSPFNLT